MSYNDKKLKKIDLTKSIAHIYEILKMIYI